MGSFGLFIQERSHAFEIFFADRLTDIAVVERWSVSLVDFLFDQVGDGKIPSLPQIPGPVAIDVLMVLRRDFKGNGIGSLFEQP